MMNPSRSYMHHKDLPNLYVMGSVLAGMDSGTDTRQGIETEHSTASASRLRHHNTSYVGASRQFIRFAS